MIIFKFAREKLCACGIWSLALRQKLVLWVFDNTMLRKVCGSKGVLMIGDWINSKMMGVIAYTPRQYYQSNKIKNYGMGRACGKNME